MSRYLLDTCVISEPLKRQPDKRVLDWWRSRDDLMLYLPTLVIGELEKGIQKLPDTRRRAHLKRTMESIIERFGTRILPVDTAVALCWGRLMADCEQKGSPVPAIDGLIAATAIAHDLVVVTRNIDDFVQTGVPTFNPFEK